MCSAGAFQRRFGVNPSSYRIVFEARAKGSRNGKARCPRGNGAIPPDERINIHEKNNVASNRRAQRGGHAFHHGRSEPIRQGLCLPALRMRGRHTSFL